MFPQRVLSTGFSIWLLCSFPWALGEKLAGYCPLRAYILLVKVYEEKTLPELKIISGKNKE